jgi:flagellar motor switch protein FliM
VSNDLSPEERQAVLDEQRGDAVPGGTVSPRDFRKPRRFSREGLGGVRRTLERQLPGLETLLGTWYRQDVPVRLEDLGEIATAGLFDGLEEPFVLLCFRIDGVQGWTIWENKSARNAAAIALGGAVEEGKTEPRRLSTLEQGVVRDLCEGVSKHCAEQLGLCIESPELVQDARAFLLAVDAGLDADPARLFLHIAIEAPDGESILRVYLPGVTSGTNTSQSAPAGLALPKHLDDVPLEFSARLGSVELALADLLELEVGDVIPLDTDSRSPLNLYIDDRPAGHAHWGSHHGQLAIRILEFDPSEED